MKDEKILKIKEMENKKTDRLSVLFHFHAITGHSPASSAGKFGSGAMLGS
jgi:hypothetical protein